MLCLLGCYWVGRSFITQYTTFSNRKQEFSLETCLFCIVINRLNILISEEAVTLPWLLYFLIPILTLLIHGLLHEFVIFSYQVLPFPAGAPWMVTQFPFLAFLIFRSDCSLQHRLPLHSSLAAELHLFDLAYKELVSLFHGFLYVSVSYLQSPPALCWRADPSAVQAPASLLSCGWWLPLLEPQAVVPAWAWAGPCPYLWRTWVWKIARRALSVPTRQSASWRQVFCFLPKNKMALANQGCRWLSRSWHSGNRGYHFRPEELQALFTTSQATASNNQIPA